MATDGDLATRWCADGTTYPQTLTVDLGRVYDLSRIEASFYGGPGGLTPNVRHAAFRGPRGSHHTPAMRVYRSRHPRVTYVYGYDLYVSNDGSEWTILCDRSDNTTPGLGIKTFDHTGRYVRAIVTGVSSRGVRASLYELRVYGQ
jgi:hypothetical protein